MGMQGCSTANHAGATAKQPKVCSAAATNVCRNPFRLITLNFFVLSNSWFHLLLSHFPIPPALQKCPKCSTSVHFKPSIAVTFYWAVSPLYPKAWPQSPPCCHVALCAG